MKINLSFIPQNTAPLGARSIGLYDSNGNKLRNIPLGNLAPKSTGNMLYRFGALSDVHLPYNTGPEDFTRALNYFNNIEKVNFICISGDMGSTGVDSEWANFKAHVDAHSPNTPVHISAGNHDAGQSAHKTHDYPIPYTGNPLYYSFTQGDDVFIMFGLTFALNPPFSKESLQWLYETLEENRNKRCFVFQHMMRKGHAGDASGRYPWDGLDNINGQVFLSLMEHYKNVLWFHGHSHNEFEHQDTLALPNSNYDRAFGCHSIHVPSCCVTRNESNGYNYEDSEGYVVDVYKNGIHLRARDFIAGKFLPIASYWIDTTPTTITANSYIDSTGTINTGSSTPSYEITLPEGSELYLNKRYSKSGGGLIERIGAFTIFVPIETDGMKTYSLKFENLITTIKYTNSLLYVLDSNKSNPTTVNGNCDFGAMTEGSVIESDGRKTAEVILTPPANSAYLAISVVVNTESIAISEENIKNYIITLEKVSNDEINQYNVTNVLPLSIDVNGNDFVGANGEDGYIQGYRINSSGDMVEQEGYCATGFIPLSSSDDIVRITNIVQSSSPTYDRIAVYNSSKELLVQASLLPNDGQMFIEEGNVLKFKPSVLANTSTPAFIRFSTKTISKDTIVTINEVITKESYSTNVLPLAINADGTDFVGINGEDGYKTGYRLNWDPIEQVYQGACVSGYIPVNQSSVIRIKNITQWDVTEKDGSVDRIVWYDSNKAYLGQTTLMKTNGGMKMEDNNNTYKFSPGYWVSGTAFIRFSTGVINKNTIVTVDEPIFEPSEEGMD